MALKLTTPVIQEYALTKTDVLFPSEGPATTISVRSASTGDVEARGSLFSKFKRNFQVDGSFSIEQEVTMDDVRRKEVYLTLAACNATTDDGSQLFLFEKNKLVNEALFVLAWSKLPPEVADEIHEKVIEHNKIWSAEGEVTPTKE